MRNSGYCFKKWIIFFMEGKLLKFSMNLSLFSFSRIKSNSIFMSYLCEILIKLLNKKLNKSKSINCFVSGAFSGIISSSLLYPFDFLRV